MVNFEQCCITCDDPNYIAGIHNRPNTPIETYETVSPDTIGTSTLLHDHPSCDDQEVKFKSSVLYFQSYYVQGMLFLRSHIKTEFIPLFLDHLPSVDSFGIGTNLSAALNNTLLVRESAM